jgi:hypothetical protein
MCCLNKRGFNELEYVLINKKQPTNKHLCEAKEQVDIIREYTSEQKT